MNDRGHRATILQRHPLAFHQALGALNIIGSSSMLKSFNPKTIMLIPLASPPMQGRYSIGLFLHQVGMENVCKKGMVAKPVAFIIQW